MLEIIPRCAKPPMTLSIRYPVMVIGGAEDKVNQCTILSAFFHSVGGDTAKIGIIPCASREPSVVGDRYYQIFTRMGAQQVQILDIRHPDEANEDRWSDVIRSCTGIFITGGDQVRLCRLIAGTQLMSTIKSQLALDQLVLAGTSAGAAIMGQRMISGGSSGESPNHALVDLADGLGIIPELLVDQHFHNRNRMARLMSAVAAYPDRLGIGIDEDTCAALLGDGTFQVLGKGTITVIDPGRMTHSNYFEVSAARPISLHNLKVHILGPGDRYDYQNRSVLSPQPVLN